MIPNLKIFLAAFLFFTGLHLAVYSNLPSDYQQFQIFFGHIFLLAFALVLDFILNRVKKMDETLVGKTFMAFSTFKMIGGLVFLLPWILNKDDATMPFVLQFFLIYFIYLALEVILILRSYLTN